MLTVILPLPDVGNGTDRVEDAERWPLRGVGAYGYAPLLQLHEAA